MPKLSKAAAKRVDSAESTGGDFEPLPEGPYIVRLAECKVGGEGPAGPYWTWQFDVEEPDEHKGRKLWSNTSLSEKADWKLKEVFEAFGYSTDSDTDEIIGEKCKVIVEQRVIEQGARKGQNGNNIVRHVSLDDDGDGDAGEGGEDIFD